jgi:hypothetical protein
VLYRIDIPDPGLEPKENPTFIGAAGIIIIGARDSRGKSFLLNRPISYSHLTLSAQKT